MANTENRRARHVLWYAGEHGRHEEYYTHIRRGHAPTPEQLAELTDRYEAIVGGVFPLRENTNRQVDGLQATLDARELRARYAVIKG